MTTRIKTSVLLHLSFALHLSSGSGSHTLVFLSTGRWSKNSQLVFAQLIVFDNITVSKCDGVTRRQQFKPRLQNVAFPEGCDEAHGNIWESMHTIQDHTNISLDVVQRRRGCSRAADGAESAFEAWAVNGEDFLTFNPDTLTWTSVSHSSMKVKEIWEKERTRNHAFGAFLKNFCSEMIQKMDLKPVSKMTELQVFAKPLEHSDEAQLLCHVKTTDPSVRSVLLTGDGAARVSGFSVMGPLPSGGDAWILRLKTRISLSQTHLTYGCTVLAENHNLTVFWNGTTLDGRYIYYSMAYKFVNAIIGFFAVIALILVMSCAMIALLNIINRRRRPPPPAPPPELREQFESFMQSSTLDPEVRNILLSFLYGSRAPDADLDCRNQWFEMMKVDDEFYGRWV